MLTEREKRRTRKKLFHPILGTWACRGWGVSALFRVSRRRLNGAPLSRDLGGVTIRAQGPRRQLGSSGEASAAIIQHKEISAGAFSIEIFRIPLSSCKCAIRRAPNPRVGSAESAGRLADELQVKNFWSARALAGSGTSINFQIWV